MAASLSRKSCLLLCACLLLVACQKMPPLAPLEMTLREAERDRQLEQANAAWEARKMYQVDGVKFTLAVYPDKSAAIVGVHSGRPVTHGELDDFVFSVAGCRLVYVEEWKVNEFKQGKAWQNLTFPLAC